MDCGIGWVECLSRTVDWSSRARRYGGNRGLGVRAATSGLNVPIYMERTDLHLLGFPKEVRDLALGPVVKQRSIGLGVNSPGNSLIDMRGCVGIDGRRRMDR